MEANILMFKCPKAKKPFGVRVQRMSDGDWWRTWAFKLREKQAESEGYDKSVVKGNLNITEEYPGCPYCGSASFVQCGRCKKISCWNGEKSLVCQWCGGTMSNMVEATEKLNVSGGKF